MDWNEYRRPQYPLLGIPVSELTAALAVVAATVPGIGEETRILRMDTRREGYLFVETGRFSGIRAGGGHDILLHRTEDGWVVVNEGSWRA
ncbi:hypothetical protein [Fimbriiglobus ruber]|uniref:Uncharacterized protein n=1 Tax=Fimbriiglobus ruber TaxID=1908690 RepID=A0A225DBY0_9BACT|nr:hypothetical protein [Fimbriiglobus ruber]OWK38493.1 hypothetical protein FRUB_07613 [Fimbriiglobus ruber]